MEKTSGLIAKDDGEAITEDMLFTYDENEKQENEINKANAKLIFQPAFIPFFPSVQKQFSLTDTECKLYGFIWFYLSSSSNRFYFTNEQLATILNCNPDTVSRSFKALEEKQLVKTFRKMRAGGGLIRFVVSINPELTNYQLGNLQNLQTNNNKINNNKSVTKVTQNEYGDTRINKIISHLKETLNLPKLDQSIKVNRRYAKLLLDKSDGNLDGVLSLIDLTATDDWYKNNITSTKDLYYKAIKIIARKRGQNESIRIATFNPSK